MKQQVKQDPIAVEKLSIKHHRYGPKPRTVRWAKRRLSRQRRHESNRFMQEVWQEQDQDAALDGCTGIGWGEYSTLHNPWAYRLPFGDYRDFEWDAVDAYDAFERGEDDDRLDDYYKQDEQERLADDRYADDYYDDRYGDPDDDWHDEPRRESQAKRDLHDSLDAARALIRAYESKEIWYSYHDECLVHEGSMSFELWSACTAFRLVVKEL